MVDKDAKVREMRRENLLLTSKIQLLEDQMENLNERVDRTLRERNQFRREIQTVRLDGNLAFDVRLPTSVPRGTTHDGGFRFRFRLALVRLRTARRRDRSSTRRPLRATSRFSMPSPSASTTPGRANSHRRLDVFALRERERVCF